MCKSIRLVLQSKLLFYEQVFNYHISHTSLMTEEKSNANNSGVFFREIKSSP